MNPPLSAQEKRWWLLAALLLAGVAAATAWKLWPLLFPRATLMVLGDPACDLNAGPCSAAFPHGGRLELSLSPRPLAVLKPLSIEVRAGGLAVKQMEVDFAGVDMYMGFNRPALTPGGQGVWAGQTVLPVCTRADMPWQASVLLDTPEGMYTARFRFRAGN